MEHKQNESPLLRLPVELIIQVFSYLEVSDLHNIYDTCHFLQDIINDEELWKNLFLKKFKTTRFSSISRSSKFSIELIKRQQLQTKWKKSTGIHKNIMVDVPNVEKLIFQYPKILLFSDQGDINIMSIDRAKTEVSIPLTTPSGCTAYHFNPSGSVFGRFDGKIFTKLLTNKSSYLSSVTPMQGQHEGVVTAIYNDDVFCWSGDERGEVYKWDLKTRKLLQRIKISDRGVSRVKGSNGLIVALTHGRILVVENGVVEAIDLKDIEHVEFFECDISGKLIVIASLDKLRVYSFDHSLFGKYHEIDLRETDQFLALSLERKNYTTIDDRIAGKDGCNLGIITRVGIVMCVNIRSIIVKNDLNIQPQVQITPIFDNLNVPEGIPPIRSIAVNSSVILLGSYNGFAAIYDVLTGEFLRTASVRIPKRYLPLTEDSFLIPVKAVQLGQANESNGIVLTNNIIQYFQYGDMMNGPLMKKKTKKSITGASGDRKNRMHKKIKHDIDELEHREYEDYRNERLLSKYNGGELTDQEQIELAMALNNSLHEQESHRQTIIREARESVEDEEMDEELARALELSRLEHSFAN